MNLSAGIIVFEIPSVKATLSKSQVKFWRQWIEALKSNNYIQSRSALRNLSGFSCMGVAADLLIAEKNLELSWGQQQFGVMPLLYKNDDIFLSILPPMIMKKIGLVMEFPINTVGEEYHIVSSNGLLYSLSQLNTKGATFEDIAKVLEIALEGGYKNKK